MAHKEYETSKCIQKIINSHPSWDYGLSDFWQIIPTQSITNLNAKLINIEEHSELKKYYPHVFFGDTKVLDHWDKADFILTGKHRLTINKAIHYFGEPINVFKCTQEVAILEYNTSDLNKVLYKK